MQTHRNDARRARIAVAVAFVVHAGMFATWAPRIPAIKDALGLDHDDLGVALGGMAAGLLIGTRLTGWMERHGHTGRGLRVLVPLQAATLVGPAYATNLLTLTAALFGMGLLGGMIDVLMNAHAVAVERRYRRPIMSGFHGLWSLGSMAGSAAAAMVARAGVDVRLHFLVAAVVLAVLSAPALAGVLTADRELATASHRMAAASPAGRPRLGVLVIGMLCLIGFGGFVTEGAVADWGAVFLHEDRGTSDGFAALGLTVFFGAMAASRLIADRVGLRVGPVVVARAGAALGLAGFAVFLLAPSPVLALVGFAVAGFGLGPLVPIVFSAAGNSQNARGTSMLSPVVSAGYLGAIVGPLMIGVVADRVGLAVGLGIPVVFLALILITAGLLAGAAARRVGGDQGAG